MLLKGFRKLSNTTKFKNSEGSSPNLQHTFILRESFNIFLENYPEDLTRCMVTKIYFNLRKTL